MSKDKEMYISVIAMSGEAKTLFVEAIDQAESGVIEKAYQLYGEGCDLLKQVGNYTKIDLESVLTVTDSMICAHMQDYIFMAETIGLMAFKFIKLYEEREKWKK